MFKLPVGQCVWATSVGGVVGGEQTQSCIFRFFISSIFFVSATCCGFVFMSRMFPVYESTVKVTDANGTIYFLLFFREMGG